MNKESEADAEGGGEHAGFEHEDGVDIEEGVHAAEIGSDEETVEIDGDSEECGVESGGSYGAMAVDIELRTAVDAGSETKAREEIDVVAMEVGEAESGHRDDVDEELSGVAFHLFSETVAYCAIPCHTTAVQQGSDAEPAVEAILIFDEIVLEVMVVFLIVEKLAGGTGGDEGGGLMEDERLEDLVAPPDAELIARSGAVDARFGMERRQEHPTRCQKKAANSFERGAEDSFYFMKVLHMHY